MPPVKTLRLEVNCRFCHAKPGQRCNRYIDHAGNCLRVDRSIRVRRLAAQSATESANATPHDAMRHAEALGDGMDCTACGRFIPARENTRAHEDGCPYDLL